MFHQLSPHAPQSRSNNSIPPPQVTIIIHVRAGKSDDFFAIYKGFQCLGTPLFSPRIFKKIPAFLYFVQKQKGDHNIL